MIPTKEIKALRAFHGKKAIKAMFLERVKKHEKADEIIQRTYWDGQKGCAVGCTLERKYIVDDIDIHTEFENQLGIPKAIASLEDALFEMMGVEDSKKFPRRFLESINVGAKLYMVAPKFIVFVLKDALKNVGDDKNCEKAIKDVIKLWEDIIKGKTPKAAAWSAAKSAAESAARSAAESAAESAARSAAKSVARSAAESAAESAARSAAESAAWSAAKSVARSAAKSVARSAAESVARSAAGKRYADYLLELLKAAK